MLHQEKKLQSLRIRISQEVLDDRNRDDVADVLGTQQGAPKETTAGNGSLVARATQLGEDDTDA